MDDMSILISPCFFRCKIPCYHQQPGLWTLLMLNLLGLDPLPAGPGATGFLRPKFSAAAVSCAALFRSDQPLLPCNLIDQDAQASIVNKWTVGTGHANFVIQNVSLPRIWSFSGFWRMKAFQMSWRPTFKLRVLASKLVLFAWGTPVDQLHRRSHAANYSQAKHVPFFLTQKPSSRPKDELKYQQSIHKCGWINVGT